MDDVSLHPCVRLKRWENERILSFVPPDGSFCLMTYHVGCQSAVAIPIYIRHNFFLPKENSQSQTGKIEITVGPRQTMGRVVKSKHIYIFFLRISVSLSILIGRKFTIEHSNAKIRTQLYGFRQSRPCNI